MGQFLRLLSVEANRSQSVSDLLKLHEEGVGSLRAPVASDRPTPFNYVQLQELLPQITWELQPIVEISG